MHVSISPLIFPKFIQLLLENTNQVMNRFEDYLQLVRFHFIPMVNPDGAEYDLKGRSLLDVEKNTRGNKDGSRGVDLNRNYGFQWGTGGSSKRPSSDVYMGPEPLVNQRPKDSRFLNANDIQLTTLVSFHTFPS